MAWWKDFTVNLRLAYVLGVVGTEWPLHLPWVLLGLRAAPKEISGLSSAEAVFGQQLVLPHTLLALPEASPEDFKERLASAHPPQVVQPHTYAEVAARNVQPELLKANLVYVQRGGAGHALATPYVGPYRVLQPGPKFFLLQVGDRVESVSIDRLKPHLGLSPLQPASPPHRGRPRKIHPP